MDKKTILKQIKELIKFSGDVVENKFLDAKLIDGTTIVRVEADAIGVGLPLFVVTEDGLIPAPAGEHTLEDGTKVYVDEAGIITDVEAPEIDVEAPAAEAPVVEELADENFYTWDACMVDMMDEYQDEEIAKAVCGKIKADGYIMSKEEAFAEAAALVEKPKEEVVEDKPEEMKKKMEEMEARIAEIEKMMGEMLPMMKETAEFSNSVLGKLDNFVKDTPAELEFKSIKTEYKKVVEENKTNKFSGLEGIKNIRKK